MSQGVEISKEDVSNFISDYIHLRYTWSEMSADLILKNISPMTTRGFLNKTKDQIEKESEKRAESENFLRPWRLLSHLSLKKSFSFL